MTSPRLLHPLTGFQRAQFKFAVPLLIVAILHLSGVPTLAQEPPQLEGCPVFPANNIWNTPVDTLPLDPRSADYINTIGADTRLHPDFGTEWDGEPIGIPWVSVPGSQARVSVSFEYAEESDPGPYPVPPDAPIEGGANSDGDRHVLVLDRDNCKLYELYYAWPQADGSWQAGSGAVFDLRNNALRPAGWTSADAAGLPILPGLVRYEEVQAGVIRHAIRFTAQQTRQAYVWPARHYASNLTGAQYPRMGQRFRLKADYDISGFSSEAQVILQAMKTYGIILADNGSDWYISGAHDMRWDDDALGDLKSVPGSAFEAVDVSSLMVNSNSAEIAGFTLSVSPTAQTVAPGQTALYAVSLSGAFSGTVSLTVSAASGFTPTLQSNALPVPGKSVLSVTNAFTGPTLIPGVVYRPVITAVGGAYTRVVTPTLLVGGARVYLPLIVR